MKNPQVIALGHHFEAKTTAYQNNNNKSNFLAFGHHFKAKTMATNPTSQHGGIISRPKQRQQILLLSIGAPLRGQDNGRKSYF